ncbi:hypothetical protein DFH09DRAFT_1146905 [Mycena vulgaris]|nr:hypothetical protein DFH09DRAFT_1146905 [Mycena vulgaris]
MERKKKGYHLSISISALGHPTCPVTVFISPNSIRSLEVCCCVRSHVSRCISDAGTLGGEDSRGSADRPCFPPPTRNREAQHALPSQRYHIIIRVRIGEDLMHSALSLGESPSPSFDVESVGRSLVGTRRAADASNLRLTRLGGDSGGGERGSGLFNLLALWRICRVDPRVGGDVGRFSASRKPVSGPSGRTRAVLHNAVITPVGRLLRSAGAVMRALGRVSIWQWAVGG